MIYSEWQRELEFITSVLLLFEATSQPKTISIPYSQLLNINDIIIVESKQTSLDQVSYLNKVQASISLFFDNCICKWILSMSVKQIQGYTILMNKVLGKGSYGSVYIGKQDNTGQEVAVKILSKDSIDKDQYLKAALKNEIQILQKLHSDNVVGFYDVMESSKNYYIIQQLCDGDLSSDIKPGLERAEPEAIEMLRQICNGFLALVKEGIIHRDLKPANIMKKGKVLKLGDFGFAKKNSNKSMVTTCVGTPLYMSLQILKGEQYTSKCDIWALGFIFYQILHGDTPWTANTQIQLVKNIQKNPLKIKRKLSPEVQDFLRKCLQLKEINRISWDQIFVHPIFKGYFLAKSDTRQFENKMKMIMNKLRFYISQRNLDLKKIMDSLGFGQGKDQISYQDFYQFFLRVYPQINNEEADYVFKKTDVDQSGSISVEQLKTILVSNGIKLQSQFEAIPSFQKREDGRQSFKRISQQTSIKIKNCFQKLYKIINKNSLTLWKVFNDFDKKKGSLTVSEFTLLIKKLSNNYIEISQDQIKNGFQLIDQDGSNSIQFAQLDKYYSKINGIMPQIKPPPKYQAMVIENQVPIQQQQRNYPPQQQFQQQPYQHNYNQQQPSHQQRPQSYQNPQQSFQQPYQSYQQAPYQSYQQPNYQQQSNFQQPYMSFSANSNNGNLNIPMGGYNYPPMGASYPPIYDPNSSQQNHPGFNQGQNNGTYNSNFNPFDILGKRM